VADVSAVLHGVNAVVTGAGRGLGRAIAVGFAQAGARVWIGARTATELEITAQQIKQTGGTVHVAQVDLGSVDGCAELVRLVRAEHRQIDVLVNNAAVLDLVGLEDLTPAMWQRTIAVNLGAPFLLTRAFLPEMRQHGGSVINVSSRAGVMPFARESAYCASKFGLEGFTRSIALELEGAPVSINTVTPGARIKPTSITDADVAKGSTPGAAEWQDPTLLLPAFLFLATLRGHPSGMRFDAFRLTQAIAAARHFNSEMALELAE
jgi:NAD(P)-dependent dehydrogenase (short-subunit alcohol dehydrogenase family)